LNSYKIKDLISDKISGEWGNEENGSSSVNVLRTTNFTNSGKINYKNVVKRDIEQALVDKKKLMYGDLIIEKSGGSPTQPVGRVVFFDNPTKDTFLCNNFTAILRPTTNVFSKYLFYFLFYNHITKKTLKFQNKTTGILNLKLERYLEEKVSLPPLPKQKRIAEILDKADSIRQKRKESIALLDEFLRSVFLDMFGDPVRNEKGWEMKTLRELSDHIVDCPHSTPIHSSRITQFPCIRTTELRNGYIDWSRMKYVEKEVYDERTKRLIPKEGDIVFGREGTFGGAVRIPGNTTICLGQRVMLFRPNKAFVNSIFLWNLIRSKSIFQQATKKSTGSTVSHVNVKDIVKFKGICPPLNLQAQFAKIVEQVEATKAKMEESLREMDNQFNGLLQRAFGGRNIEN